MDFREAISLAQAGNERGFGYLYENTYRSKYYLALQYMKNEETVKDVVQEAYIKAFSNLDKLQNPEVFPSWLGTIVANTAKNALAKKNPMLFSDVAVDDEAESFEYQIEDDNIDNQPELSYTKQETRDLVHELINALSDEQRICVLMFHIEGISIREIAETLNCSDNTVKSRLNYGRKNLKIKAEELQKKGYKLYSVAPLPLLLLLLHSDQTAMSLDGMLGIAGKSMINGIFRQIPILNETAGISAPKGTTAKAGFLHTTAGKITALIMGVCITGGVAFYGITQLLPDEKEPVAETETKSTEQEVSDTESETTAPEQEPSVQEEQPPTEQTVADEEYPNLIAGNLTKEELEYVLAYGPEEIPAQGFSETDYQNLLAWLCCSKEEENPITYLGKNSQYKYQYSLVDINRVFSSFTDFQFTQDNIGSIGSGFSIVGEALEFAVPTLSAELNAAITSAVYTDTEMKVYYDYTKTSYELGTTNSKKVATLKPTEDGLYRIVKIEIATDDAASKVPDEAAAVSPAANTVSMKQIYQGVLQSVQNQEAGYTFSEVEAATGAYQYFTTDMNGDGIQELVVGAENTVDVFMGHYIRVYSCENTDTGYQLKPVQGDMQTIALHIPADGNGLYDSYFSRGTGKTSVYRISIQNGTLAGGLTSVSEQEFTMGDSAAEAFQNGNQIVEWRDISDLAGLDGIN